MFIGFRNRSVAARPIETPTSNEKSRAKVAPMDAAEGVTEQTEISNKNVRLSDLAVGEEAEVLGFAGGEKAYRSRLLAMGLTPGTRFTVTRIAPLGDPVEIRLRGFSLSLRKAEADALRLVRL